MPDRQEQPISIWNPDVFFLTWGGSGLLKPASGTWGSLAAIPFAIFIHTLAGWLGLLAAAALLYAIAFYVVQRHESRTGRHDGSYIVVDEVIGMFIALSVANMNVIDVTAAFFLFRAFDALKPGIIGRIDRDVSGAHGVLLDDVFAGGLAAVCVVIIHVLA